jgi:hypothetical protein
MFALTSTFLFCRTSRTATPVHDLGLVDLVAIVVAGRETGSRADRAVDIDHAAAGAADQMVVVVGDAILEASRRSGGLNAPYKAFGNEHSEGVVHRLEGDGADLGPYRLGDRVGADVGISRYGSQNCQTLGGNLNAALPEDVGRISCQDELG